MYVETRQRQASLEYRRRGEQDRQCLRTLARGLLAASPMIINIRLLSLAVAVLVLEACEPQVPQRPSLQPSASLQELMQNIVDPSADGVWNSVETVVTQSGESTHQPHTPEEWSEVRRAAITLSESANLLLIQHRRVGVKPFLAEASGALDSGQIQTLIDTQRAAFDGFAVALREAAFTSVSAIDARDPVSLVGAGGAIDEICEGCHLKFWYPNQVIPSLPSAPPRAAMLAPKHP